MRSVLHRRAQHPSSSHKQGIKFPPEFGPLAAVTPGTPGGLMTMLAGVQARGVWPKVLAPAIEMADGYPMEAELSKQPIEKYKDKIAQVAVLEADNSHPPGV